MSRTAKRIMAGIGALLALILVILIFAIPTFEVRVPESQVQEMVDKKMPFVGQRRYAQYTISDVKISLRRDGKINVDANVDAAFGANTGKFKVNGSGVPKYRDGAFYLGDFAMGPVELVSSETHQSASRAAAKAIIGKIAEKAGVKDELVSWYDARKDEIQSELRVKTAAMLMTALEKHPVYTLKEGLNKQGMARMALKSVSIENQELVVVLSPMSFLCTIFIWVVVAVITVALIVAMLVSDVGPLGFLALGLFG